MLLIIEEQESLPSHSGPLLTPSPLVSSDGALFVGQPCQERNTKLCLFKCFPRIQQHQKRLKASVSLIQCSRTDWFLLSPVPQPTALSGSLWQGWWEPCPSQGCADIECFSRWTGLPPCEARRETESLPKRQAGNLGQEADEYSQVKS